MHRHVFWFSSGRQTSQMLEQATDPQVLLAQVVGDSDQDGIWTGAIFRQF